VSGNGSVRNLTETIFTRRQWQALVPETILGVEHDDVYHFFYSETVLDTFEFTTQVSAADNVWRSVAWGNGQYVAVAANGANQVMTSPDGVTWTSRSATASADWGGVAYGTPSGVPTFVAVANSLAMRSTNNGVSWSAAATPPTISNAFLGICWSADLSLFVAVSTGVTAYVSTSPDGDVWTSRTAPAGVWAEVVWGNGTFVAVGGDINGPVVMTSPDGVNWTSRTTSATTVISGVAFGAGLFVGVCESGSNRIHTSPDGITWTARSAAQNIDFRSVAWNGNHFAAVGSSAVVNVSEDGITWTLATSGIAGLLWLGITSDGADFVGVAGTGTGNRAFLGHADEISVGVAGRALDMKETGFGLITLSYHASAVHSDPLTDNLYLVLTEDEEPTGPSGTLLGSTAPLLSAPYVTIYQFDADEDVTPMTYRHRGKLNLLSRPAAFVYCQVKADDYDNLVLNLYADGVLFFSDAVLDSEPFTLPLTDEYVEFEYEFVGTSRVRTAQFVEDIRELT